MRFTLTWDLTVTAFVLHGLFCTISYAYEEKSVTSFVDRDTKVGQMLQLFEKGDRLTMDELASLASKEVDLAVEMKNQGYVTGDVNKLALFGGHCGTAKKPELLDDASLALKNLPEDKDKVGTYVFPTWDRDTAFTNVLFSPIVDFPADWGFGSSKGIKFDFGLVGLASPRELRVTPAAENKSRLVNATTFRTFYKEPFYADNRNSRVNYHTMNYEMRKVQEEGDLLVLKEILAASEFADESGGVGAVSRFCLFELSK